MNGEIQNFKDVITSTMQNISASDANRAFTTIDLWKKVLLRIKSKNPNEGQNLASHSRVINLKNGVLFVEADHPGWIELLQLHKKYILTGINMENKDLGVQNLAFILKGNRADVYDFDKEKKSEADVCKIIEKNIQEEEENLKKYGFDNDKELNSAKKKEVSPEIAAMLENIKQDLLTNSKNK